MTFPLHDIQSRFHPLCLQCLYKFLALLPRDQIVSGAMNQVCRRSIRVALYLGQGTDGGNQLVAGLGKVGVLGIGIGGLGGRGEFARETVKEDGKVLAFPVHVQDDAGAGVGGRHPTAEGEMFGWNVVLGDLEKLLVFSIIKRAQGMVEWKGTLTALSWTPSSRS